jgi:hypothetical protein
MPRVGFKPTSPVFGRAKTFLANVIGNRKMNMLNFHNTLGGFLAFRSDLLKTEVDIDRKFYFHRHVESLVLHAVKFLRLITRAWQGFFRSGSQVSKDEKSEQKNCLQSTFKQRVLSAGI